MTTKLKFILAILMISDLLARRTLNPYSDGTRFRSVECTSDNYTIVLLKCYLKAYSRRIVTLTFIANVVWKLEKPIYVQLLYYYRYGNIYRQVINTKPLEWCSIMSGESNHPLMTHVITQLKNAAPTIFHKCPYEGIQEFLNVTIDDKKTFDIFPQGFYQTRFIVFNKSNHEIFQVNIFYEVKSILKESMG